MADESLKWALDFNLQGDGLRQANAGVSQLLQGLTDGRKGMVEFEAAGQRMRISLDGTASATERAGGGMKALRDLAGGATAAVGMLTAAVAAGGVALNKFGDMALAAFRERSSTLRAYTTLLGSSTKAEEEFARAQNLAAMTDLTAGDTLKAQQQLMVAGFRDKKLTSTLMAGMDLASISTGDKNEALKSFSRATGQILQKGKLQQEELLQLAEGASLSTGLVKEELRKALGLKTVDDVDKRQKAGGIDAITAITAIQRAVLAQLGTNKLGAFATGSAGSVQGLISNRDEAFKILLKGFDSEVLPGMMAYKAALVDQAQGLSVASEQGKNLSLVLQDFSSVSLGLKAAWTDFSTGFLESFTSTYLAARQATGEFGGTRNAAMELGTIVGKVGTLFGHLANALEALEPIILKIAKASALAENFGGGARKLLSGDIKGWWAEGTSASNRSKFEETWNETTADLRAKRADRQQAQDRAGLMAELEGGDPSGAVTGGGAPQGRFQAQPLSNWGGYRLKGAKATAGGGKGGGGGSGGGGGGGGGWSSYGWDPVGPQEVANYASDLSSSLAGAGSGGGSQIRVDRVEIVINGAGKSPEQIAEAVEDKLLRNLGRYARTPAPGR